MGSTARGGRLRRIRMMGLVAGAAALLAGQCGRPAPKSGDEADLIRLANLERVAIPDRPGGFQTLYVSTDSGGDYPMGDDANPGTAEAPLRSLNRVRQILLAGTCGVEVVFDGGETWTGADFGEGLREIPLTCAGQPDEITVYLRSSDPEAAATFDCRGGNGWSGVVRATATGDGGWLVVENLHLQFCALDGFDTVGDAKMLTLNSGAVACRGNGNQCFTPHDDSRMIVINGYASAEAGADTIVSAGHAAFAFIGGGPFVQDGAGKAVLSARSSGGGLVIGGEFTAGPSAVATSALVGVSSAAVGDDNSLMVVRAHVHGAVGSHGAAVRAQASDDDAHVELQILQSTLSSSPHAIVQQIDGVGARFDFLGRCVLMDEIGGPQWWSYGPDDVANSTVQFENSIYDDDDSTASFRIADNALGAANDLADALGQIAALDTAGTWTRFLDDANSYDSGGQGIDGIQWDGDDDLGTPGDTIADEGCHPGKACEAACSDVVSAKMPVALPAFVIGKKVAVWKLDRPSADIGAQ